MSEDYGVGRWFLTCIYINTTIITLFHDCLFPRVTGIITPPKSNIDTQNDGFLDVSPFKHGYFGYLR